MASVALVARLHGLGSKPLWYDEVLTLKRSGLPFPELVADSFHNKHYPLYFLLTKPFATADWSEAALRLPACIFGAVSVLMAARIAGDIAGRWAAIATGLLMALSPLEVQYGQEARPYALGSAAMLTAVWGLVRLFRPVDAWAPAKGDGQRSGWIAYALGMAIALNSIGVAAIGFVTVNAIVGMLVATRKLPTGWSMRIWFLVNLVILAAWLPGLISFLLANSSAATRGLNWVPPLTWELGRTVVASLYMLRVSDLLTFEPLATPVPLLGFAVVSLAIGGGARSIRWPYGIILIGMTIVLPIVLGLISLAKPMFVPRYLLWSTGPYFILAGVGLAAVPSTLIRVALLTAVVFGATMALWPYYKADTKPRWDLAAAYLAQRAQIGDATVVSSGLARVMLSAYISRMPSATLDPLKAQSKEEILRAYESGANIWLVHGRAGQGGILIDHAEFAARWADLGPARESAVLGRHIIVWRHARVPSAR